MLKNLRNQVAITLCYLPLTVIAVIVALRTFIYGIGYIIPTSGFEQTVLYSQLSTLLTPVAFGSMFVILSLAMVLALIKQNTLWVKRLFTFNAFIWLFALFVYVLAGTPLLGFGIAGIFSLISGYIGSAFERKDAVVLFNAMNMEKKWD